MFTGNAHEVRDNVHVRLDHGRVKDAQNVFVPSKMAEELELHTNGKHPLAARATGSFASASPVAHLAQNSLPVHQVSEDILYPLDCNTPLCHRVVRRADLACGRTRKACAGAADLVRRSCRAP